MKQLEEFNCDEYLLAAVVKTYQYEKWTEIFLPNKSQPKLYSDTTLIKVKEGMYHNA